MAMNPRLLRPRASGFNPTSIANLAFWLDATDSSTIDTVSGAVSTWRSKVGSGSATQDTANNRPVLTTSGRNGRNVITFDGTDDFLTTSTLSINQSFTICFAGKTTGLTAADGVNDFPYVCDGAPSTTRIVMAWNWTGGGTFNGRPAIATGSTAIQADGVYGYNDWCVFTGVFSGASSAVRINGTQITSGNAGTGNISALRLGERQTSLGNTAFDGPWGAFLIYSRVLTATELTTVERYLGKLFAVTVA